ncbi:MAG TPA: pilin [Limnobacter sp.]|uniref:pilin n=1 Tax=Limnobacter sp. TaxID=2003368 RepID=UPI002ED97130
MSPYASLPRRALNSRAGGFTLIELMIAIAIVGVLAAIAVPAFANYLARGRVSEAINYAQTCKTGFIEFYSTKGAVPTTNSDANCPTVATDNVRSVAITNNPPAVVVNLVNTSVLPTAIRNQSIILQPLNAAGARLNAANGDTIVSWRCSVGTSTAAALAGTAKTDAYNLVPAICRNDPV